VAASNDTVILNSSRDLRQTATSRTTRPPHPEPACPELIERAKGSTSWACRTGRRGFTSWACRRAHPTPQTDKTRFPDPCGGTSPDNTQTAEIL